MPTAVKSNYKYKNTKINTIMSESRDPILKVDLKMILK